MKFPKKLRLIPAVFPGLAVIFGAALANDGNDVTASTQVRQLDSSQQINAIETYRELLSFANDASYPENILELVGWLESQFSARGFQTRRILTKGSPLLFAERRFEGVEKTALIYLQADGQPVDSSKWDQSNPYEAVLKKQTASGAWEAIGWPKQGQYDPDWRIFARSASDSKGPIAQFLSAIDAIDSTGIKPRFNFKVIIDTEEEMGSPNLSEALQHNDALMQADFMLVFDGPPHASNKPTIVFGARGLTTITLTTFGPEKPQHSGHYGNFAPNPAFNLAHILSSMKDVHGRVRIDGFYNDIKIDKTVRLQLDAVPDDEAKILYDMKLAAADKVAKTLQQALQYPSLNIRGLSAAWVGQQTRTIIPAAAIAEIDIRTVPEIDPQRLVNLVHDHIEGLGYYVIDQAPTDEERRTYARIVKMNYNISYGAFRSDFDSPAGEVARAGMRRLYEQEPILIRTLGGSSPITLFVKALDISAVLVPTVNIDNNQHSPNENIRMGDFFAGINIILSVILSPADSENTLN